MISFSYQIKDELGLHARPAALLVKLAKEFADTEIRVEKNGRSVRATQLLGLMGLGVRCGDRISVSAEGDGEEEAAEALRAFLTEKL